MLKNILNMKYTFLLALAVATLLTGCGGGGGSDLDAKKAELVTMQNQLQATKKRIMELEAEIAALDPSAKKEEPVVQVGVDTLKESTFQHFVTVQGQVESNNNIMVSPKMAGVITGVFVKEGQAVSAGQTLAQIDNSVMVASLNELELQLDLATTVYNKQKNLWDQKIGSEIQFLEAKNRKESLDKRIATTKEQIAMTRITSPISGVVETVNIKSGEAAMPGMPAFQVVNMGDLKFTAGISEAYIPYVKKGDKVSIEFSSIDKTMQAAVSSVSQTINPVNRTVDIQVVLPKDNLLKPNLTGEISINDATLENSLVIPISVLQQSGSGDYVLVAEKNAEGQWIAQKVMVKLGLRYEDKVVVESGLKPGQLLISEGSRGLEEGQKVNFGAPASAPEQAPAATETQPTEKSAS